MRDFNCSKIKEEKWDSGVLGLIAAICKQASKQEQCLSTTRSVTASRSSV